MGISRWLTYLEHVGRVWALAVWNAATPFCFGFLRSRWHKTPNGVSKFVTVKSKTRHKYRKPDLGFDYTKHGIKKLPRIAKTSWPEAIPLLRVINWFDRSRYLITKWNREDGCDWQYCTTARHWVDHHKQELGTAVSREVSSRTCLATKSNLWW